ncbi:cytochrome P450 [Nocardia cyriacigeorgica]|uniref:cytochrome P450 family protein n=1 Tax=Nocardia cyriacigeorgica TaxID=135487 RepID=UPI001894AD1B|nr:cytochrome P450 [Nocardia cyriacigeorgica]MBF6397855.1 cytochrome P450 [Nocardia cyriacigeorgica]MBF6402488.1 cytochrome P450 [Nocardia cyriacigeorgica]
MTDLFSDPRSSTAEPFVLDVTGTDIAGEAARLRALGPLVPVDVDGVQATAATEYEAARKVFTHPAVSKDAHQHWPEFLSNQICPSWSLIVWVAVKNMFTAFGGDHTRLRRLVAPAFAPRRIEALGSRIDAIATELLGGLASRPAGVLVDLREDYATQLPLRVISELMGLPGDLQISLRICVDRIFDTSPDPDCDPAVNLTELESLLTQFVHRRRTELDNGSADRADDLTSFLIRERDENGDRLTEQELIHTLLLLVAAGYETTVNLIDNLITRVLTGPGLLDRVRAGEFGWEEMIEETLRFEPPVPHLPMRYAVDDIDIAGHDIPQGEAILVSIIAANRDPLRHGPTADEFDPTRPDQGHLAFGWGAHHCLGAPLARMEARTALSKLFDRFPALALAVPAGELQTLDSIVSLGHKALPVYLRR